ncbi:MAG: DHA1 family tetracycline resistance protein-like MFS transporter [Dokdonia sp.]|jgi:DHA1 family tetracycline resistance protein-like MFS transporter
MVNEQKKNTGVLTTLFFTLFVTTLGFGMIIPIKPQLIMDITGDNLSDTAVWSGYLLLGYALAQFLASPIISSLSDRYGRRSILLAVLMINAIDFFVMAIAQSIELLFVTRVLSGVLGATLATINACVVDISPFNKRAINFSIIFSALGLGLMVGPSLGGFLGELWGTRAPIFVAGILLLINFFYILFFFKETLKEFSTKKIALSKFMPFALLRNLHRSSFKTSYLVVTFLIQLAFHSFAATWAYFTMAKFNWGFLEIGWSLFAVGATSLIFQAGLNRIIIPKFGERKSLLIGLAFTIPAFLAYSFANQGWMIYLIIVFGGIGGVIIPSLQSIMSGMMPKQRQGELMGAISSISGLSLIIGPFLMTQTFSYFTQESQGIYFPGAPFFLAALFVTGAILIVVIKTSKKHVKNDVISLHQQPEDYTKKEVISLHQQPKRYTNEKS